MFATVAPFLDLERGASPASTAKDLDQCAVFMQNNYIEENRLWCRTAYDVGRTKNEVARRDRKRQYLAQLISKGFAQLAQYVTDDPDRSYILENILRQVK